MPELPEVETVMRGLERAIRGGEIEKALLRCERLRFPFPTAMDKKLESRTVSGLERRAKYILIHLDDGHSVLIHLGMSGRIILHPEAVTDFAKHDHVIVNIKDGPQVIFNDPRRFGFWDILNTAAWRSHKYFHHLGPEPLSDDFNAHWLSAQLKRRKGPIKPALMDQKLVVGVGNIYACEALYEAGIHPARPAKTLTAAEVERLAEAVRSVLQAAIKAGGSSLRDYRQTDGELGYFQHHFRVYDRRGQPSGRGGTVERIIQAGRSTFYCSLSQK